MGEGVASRINILYIIYKYIFFSRFFFLDDPRSQCMAVLSVPESRAASTVQGFEYMLATVCDSPSPRLSAQAAAGGGRQMGESWRQGLQKGDH